TLVGWFSDVGAVRDVGVTGLQIMSLGFPLYALGMVLEQSFNGAGDTRTPSWMNFVVFWVLQLPLAWYMSQHTALAWRGVYIAVVGAYTALAVISAFFFRRGGWKTKQV
ncbi:MAG: MATE family efflux transporter, partial [Gemmatimonas sp.]